MMLARRRRQRPPAASSLSATTPRSAAPAASVLLLSLALLLLLASAAVQQAQAFVLPASHRLLTQQRHAPAGVVRRRVTSGFSGQDGRSKQQEGQGQGRDEELLGEEGEYFDWKHNWRIHYVKAGVQVGPRKPLPRGVIHLIYTRHPTTPTPQHYTTLRRASPPSCSAPASASVRATSTATSGRWRRTTRCTRWIISAKGAPGQRGPSSRTTGWCSPSRRGRCVCARAGLGC